MSNDLQKAIDKRRSEIARFDSLSVSEQRQLREQGLDPHESKATRAKRKAAYLKKRKREFDAMPKEKRAVLESLGASPYQTGQIINRSTTYFEEHGTYVMEK